MQSLENFNIDEYIKDLTDEYPSIESIWLFGSRANNRAKEDSDWDLFVFANQEILDKLKKNKQFNNNMIDLFVIYNGKDFQLPWPNLERRNKYKSGNLNKWGWEQITNSKARYTVDYGASKDVAIKIWPK